jgi:hypothetical protein
MRVRARYLQPRTMTKREADEGDDLIMTCLLILGFLILIFVYVE